MATINTRISGTVFTIEAPYVEGHVLSAIEAGALNTHRALLIGHALRDEIKELRGAGTSEEALINRVAEFDADFTFSEKATRQPVNPIEEEAYELARTMIKRKLRSEGRNIKSVDKKLFEAAVEKVATMPAVIELAKKNIAERESRTGPDLSFLSLPTANA